MATVDRFLLRTGSTALLLTFGAACGDPALPPAGAPPGTTNPATLGATGSTAPGNADSASPGTGAAGATPPRSDGAAESDVVVGREWTDATANLLGMESYCGNLAFVSARPDTQQLLVSVVGQGLFANEPGSDEWVPFGRSENSAPIDHRTSGIVYDPDNPDQFWESGYFGLGPPPDAQASSVNRTADGGTTFMAVGNGEPADLVSVDLMDPERRTLLMGLRGQERAMVSSDSGATWSDVSADLPSDLGEASFPHVVDSTSYLLGTHKGDRGDAASPGIFRTVDGGATWQEVFDEGVAGPVLESTDGGLYWVLDGGGVVGSDDDGETWSIVSDRGPGGGRFLDARRNRIVETADGTWVSMSEDSIVMSSDRGQSWRPIGPSLPYVPSGFTYSEGRSELYLWRSYCDFEAGVNPVAEESILRVAFDPGP